MLSAGRQDCWALRDPEAKLVVGNTEIGKGVGQLWVSPLVW